jgi:PAS domain S-box-containing protein
MEVHIWQVVRDERGAITTWRLVDANPMALNVWGRNLEDIIGKTTEEIFPGADAVRTFLPLVEEIMSTGLPKHWETAFAGTGQVLHMVSSPVEDCFVSMGFDVTADHRRQRELEHALQRVTQATQAGGVGLWDWDLRTNEVHYSDEWKRQLGHASAEIADTFEEWRSRVHPDDLEPTMVQIKAAIEGTRKANDVVFRMRHKDGAYRSILAQSSILRDEAGRPQRMVGSHIDITERRRMEERVREAQKLESLGTLAAGIAHDFNNLLTAVTVNISLLRDTPPNMPQASVLLKAVEEATGRATALTKQLLTFAKGGAPVRAVASIRELILDSATFVARGSRARCEFALAESLAPVNADVGQLSQVISNLVINAIQAMPQGGTIRIGAKNVDLAGELAPALPAGRYVRITVADEGTGIAPENLPRIFDPFFTTKPTGSGLGLSTSYSIVARHGGLLSVESAQGVGTTFTVHLPASEGEVARPEKPRPVSGAGRILAMDDDDMIREVLPRALAHLGYACDACANGEETVARYRQALAAGPAYDAVILDLTIPGRQGGAEVLRQLRALDPHVVAIVASGYADDDVLAQPEKHGFRGRLHKPFNMLSLSVELSRLLRARPHAAAPRQGGGHLASD